MNMIDITRIKESYSNMLDSQLINIAAEDGHTLTPEAFQILKEEFIKRNLDPSHIESAEQTKLEIHQQKIQQIKDSAAEEFSIRIWQYILDEKETGTADSSILKGLVERGLDESEAVQMLSTTNDKVKEIIDSNDTKMLVGGVTFVLGIFITLITYSQAKMKGGIYIVAWGAIVFGAGRFFKGFAEKQKYKTLLANLNSNQSVDTE